MTGRDLFNFAGIIGALMAVACVIANVGYLKSLKRWHDHLLDWSNFLQRTHASFYDNHKSKSEEMKDKL